MTILECAGAEYEGDGMRILYHFHEGQCWFKFECIVDNLWLKDQTGIIKDVEADRFIGSEQELLDRIRVNDIWNKLYTYADIESQYISAVLISCGKCPDCASIWIE